MTRRLGPSSGFRTMHANRPQYAGRTATVYIDAAGTTLADLRAFQPSAPSQPGAVSISTFTYDSTGIVPLLWSPDEVTRCFARTPAGEIVPMDWDRTPDINEISDDVPAYGIAAPIQSGAWRMTDGSSAFTSTHASGTERANPLRVPAGTTLVAVAVNVTTLAAASVVRVGARADNNGRPGALLADWGTVDSTTTGVKTISPIAFVVPSDLIWITATAQGGNPVLSARFGSDRTAIDGATSGEVLATLVPASYFQSGVTGALPATFTSGGTFNGATLIAVQAA